MAESHPVNSPKAVQHVSHRTSLLIVREAISKVPVFVGVCLGAVFMFIPFLWVVFTSLKQPAELNRPQVSFLPDHLLNFGNYVLLWHTGLWLKYFTNSFVVTVMGLLSSLLFSTIAGYAFAKLKFPAREILFMTILALLMMPFEATVVPLFLMFNAVGLTNTYLGLAGPQLVSAIAVFLMRQFIATIPDDYLDAARIDGASELSLVWRVVVPMSVPALLTVAIIKFVMIWNDYLWPLVIVNDQAMKTVTLALGGLRNSVYVEYTTIAAGAVISLIPIVVLFSVLQRYIVQGIARAGLRG